MRCRLVNALLANMVVHKRNIKFKKKEPLGMDSFYKRAIEAKLELFTEGFNGA